MSKGFMFINGALIGRKKPGKRIESEKDFASIVFSKIENAMKIAKDRDLHVLFHGGFVENPKDLKLILNIINLLKIHENTSILLNGKERKSLLHEENTVFGVIRALNLATIVSEDGFVADFQDTSVFYVKDAESLPTKLDASTTNNFVILGEEFSDEVRNVSGSTKIVLSGSKMPSEGDISKCLYCDGGIVRRSPAAFFEPSVTLCSDAGLSAVTITHDKNVFIENYELEIEHESILDESSFVDKLRESREDIEAVTETDLIKEVELMVEDEKYSEASREILHGIFKDTLYSEMSDFI